MCVAVRLKGPQLYEMSHNKQYKCVCCGVIDSKQARHQIKTRLQTGSLVVMEMQILTTLGCRSESNRVEPGQYSTVGKRHDSIEE